MKIILKGQPQSTNNIYKSHCRFGFPKVYLTKAGKDIKDDYIRQIVKQWKTVPLKCPISVVIDTYHDNHRKNDWDNFHKLSMDSLTNIVYEDDSQIEQAIVTKHYDKENPRIEIEIIPL